MPLSQRDIQPNNGNLSGKGLIAMIGNKVDVYQFLRTRVFLAVSLQAMAVAS